MRDSTLSAASTDGAAVRSPDHMGIASDAQPRSGESMPGSVEPPFQYIASESAYGRDSTHGSEFSREP